jgi:hypothetical protein
LSVLGSAKAFLKRHPVLCLLLLSPGIPEYLSGSSPLYALLLNPPQFLLQLALNLGLYGPGVLLVREAHVRWKKGFGTILLLGAAYGILEEGVALSTLFNPTAGPAGSLGSYGHWLGVNWIWVAGIIPVHMIFSISLPILLLGLALPKTRGESFLAGRKAPVALAIMAGDVVLLLLLVLKGEGFWMGWPVFLGSWIAILALLVAARRVPPSFAAPNDGPSRVGPARIGALGVMFYPTVLLSEFIPLALKVPAFIDLILVVAVQGLFLIVVLKRIGTIGNERVLLALSLGLILPIASIGVIADYRLPLNLVADAAVVLFFIKLWRRHPPRAEGPFEGPAPSMPNPSSDGP